MYLFRRISSFSTAGLVAFGFSSNGLVDFGFLLTGAFPLTELVFLEPPCLLPDDSFLLFP